MGFTPLTKSAAAALLRAEGLRPDRRRGQNFLVDKNLLRVIAEAPGLEGSDVVLEVGAGLGQLTGLIAERAGRVVAVEIDAGLVRLLERLLAAFPNVEIIHGDVLRRRDLAPEVRRALEGGMEALDRAAWRVVANPPYNVASPFLLAVLFRESPPADLHLTLQREVVERLMSPPGRRAYGPLTVLVRSVAEVSLLRGIPATAFWPRPRVDSALVRIVPREDLRRRIGDLERFRKVVSVLFQSRRKTLQNALRRLTGEPLRFLAAADLSPERRPDALAVEELIRLSNALGDDPFFQPV